METYNELKKLTIDELKGKHDHVATNSVASLSFYREEISRRESNELSEDMLAMAKQIRNMTIAISIMTAVTVFAVIVPLVR